MSERASLTAVVLAGVGLAALGAGWLAGGGAIDLAWAPTWGARLAFALDGLGALYGLLATGIGLAVFTYAASYLPRHLHHEGQPRTREAGFHGAMVLFMVAMVGLVTAQDLVVLFVFWDLTAIASYLLIGFDRHERDARVSALMALLVTAVPAVLLLIGILVLRAEYGSFSLEDVFARLEPGTPTTVAAALIAVGALSKSAQVPLHFWLPRAMAAPTPVSAYLHSAAMVAAGVFLLTRLHPVLAVNTEVLDGLLVIGLASIAVGGALALAGDELKQVLAHSTISQYGYVVTMLGIGGRAGLAGACFYVLAHALSKAALFLTAGSVTEATGAKHLSKLGGLLRELPLVAAASGLCAAGLAALPFTIGFFKDELFFKAAAERGTWLAVLAVAGAALTFAYIGRFWAGIFLGPPKAHATTPLDRRLVWPIAALGALVAAGGVVVAPFASLAEDAAEASVEAAYHLDLRAENVMALATYAAGAALLLARARLDGALAALARLGDRLGPRRAYLESLAALNRLSDAVHDVEVRDLRGRVAAVLVPGGVLVAAGVAATPFEGAYDVGTIDGQDVPLLVALGVATVAALVATRPRRHLGMMLALSGVGFSLAVAYQLTGAPDVALVAVLIETIFTLLFVGVFALAPRDVLRREAALPTSRSRRIRDPIVAVISGLAAFALVWGALSRPAPADGMAERHVDLAEAAHGSDVVTVILADFRGLDTLVEITVIFVALLAIATLLRRGRLW